MRAFFIIFILAGLLGTSTIPAWSQNPFTSKPESRQKSPEPQIKSAFLVKITLWQHQLKQRMSKLIRDAKQGGGIGSLLLLMGLAFAYGAIHAAGPGHGKAIAISYVLSHKSTIKGGLLFGFFIAVIHGFSGVVGVLGLRHVIQMSVSGTLAKVTSITQIVSFGLITLLGLGLLLTNGYQLFLRKASENAGTSPETSSKKLLPWALAVGLVPCPAVVMVMLFCISLNVMILGLVLSACIAFGMAATISFVVTAVVVGKSGFFNAVPNRHAQTVEGVIGLLSGAAITAFGTLFFLAAINSVCY